MRQWWGQLIHWEPEPGAPLTPMRALLVVVTAAALAIAVFALTPPLPNDFYWVWFGARLFSQGVDPYSPEAQRALVETWPTAWAHSGVGYPLPVFLLALPLSLLALWLPLASAAQLKQPTLIWMGLALLLLAAWRWRWAAVAGLCMALLPLKPQVGLLFGPVAWLLALRNWPLAARWGLIWGICVYGGSLLVAPGWVGGWLAALRIYAAAVDGTWLFPLGLGLVLVSYRMPWYGLVASLQVALFPLSGGYGLMPLILGWLWLRHPAVWLGVALSWLATGNDLGRVFAGILAPYLLIVGWQMLRERRAARVAASPGQI